MTLLKLISQPVSKNNLVEEKDVREMLGLADKSKIILNQEFFNQPHEVTFRSLTEIIKFVGNKYYSARGKKVDTIIDKLKGETRVSIKLTLGNCIIHKVNQSILVLKEHKI